MSKPHEHSPQHMQNSPKLNKLFHGLLENSRRRLQDTVSSELDRIRHSVENELARQRMLERLEKEDLKERDQLLREVQLKLEKTAKLREDKLKTRKEDLKFFHTKHKEKVQAKVQVDKQQQKKQRQLSEAARAQIQRGLNERDERMRQSFKSIEFSKTLYDDAINQKNSLYQSSAGFAEKSRREVFERLQKGSSNYKQVIRQKVKNLDEHNNVKIASTYNACQDNLEKKHKQFIQSLVFSLKKSGLTLENNAKDYKERVEFNHGNQKMAKEKRDDMKQSLKVDVLEKKVECKLRHPQSADLKANEDDLPMDRKNRLMASRRKSLMSMSTARETRQTNFWPLVEKHKMSLSRRKHAKDDEIVKQQNDLQRTLRRRAQILNRSQSLHRSAVFNKQRVNPESLALF